MARLRSVLGIVIAAAVLSFTMRWWILMSRGAVAPQGHRDAVKPLTTRVTQVAPPRENVVSASPVKEGGNRLEKPPRKQQHATTVDHEGADGVVGLSIDDAARKLAVNGTLFLIPVNDGYVDFGLNLLCSLRSLGLGVVDPEQAMVGNGALAMRGVVFIAMDPIAQRKLAAMRLPVLVDPDMPLISANATGWGHEKFHSLVCTKLFPVIRLLKLGINVVLSDADIVFLKDPRPFFRRELDMTFSIGSCHKDLPDNYDFAAGDGVAKLNTGFYFARSTPGVINLLSRALTNCRGTTLTGDQPAINGVLHNDLAEKKQQYSYGFFDGCLFANGCIYFKHLCANTSIADPRPGIAAGRSQKGKVAATKIANGPPGAVLPPGHIRRDDPVMVHANFLVGKKDKIKHLVKYGLWNDRCISAWRGDGASGAA